MMASAAALGFIAGRDVCGPPRAATTSASSSLVIGARRTDRANFRVIRRRGKGAGAEKPSPAAANSGRAAAPLAVRAASFSAEKAAPSVAVLMEIDGVLADVHRNGHRQAFNAAFQDMGLDCAQWNEAVYADLIRSSGGVEEKMLVSFFKRIGWPTSLPTSDQEAFIRKVRQVKTLALEKLARSGAIQLTSGVDKFVDEVLEAGFPLVILGAYCNTGEQVARSLVDKLGSDRVSRIKFVGEAEVRQSAYGQVVFGEGVSSSLDEQLAAAAAEAVVAEKRRIAEELASVLNVTVEIDLHFNEKLKQTVAALRAGAEIGETCVGQCIFLASGSLGTQAAAQIGMPCVVIRSSHTARAEFPAAKASLDGYGPGSTTLPRLLRLR